MIRPNDIGIDVKDLGEYFLLTDIRPLFKYENGSRTDERIGTTYEVALANLGLEKIRVKIEGEQEISAEVLEQNSFVTVKFKGLKANFYLMNGTMGITAKAESIGLYEPGKK